MCVRQGLAAWSARSVPAVGSVCPGSLHMALIPLLSYSSHSAQSHASFPRSGLSSHTAPTPARGAYQLGPSRRHAQLRVHSEGPVRGVRPDQACGSQRPSSEKSRDPGVPVWEVEGCGQAAEMDGAHTEASL